VPAPAISAGADERSGSDGVMPRAIFPAGDLPDYPAVLAASITLTGAHPPATVLAAKVQRGG